MMEFIPRVGHVSSLPQNRLYKDLSWLYPFVSPLEHYIEETEYFSRIVKEQARKPVHSVLHLGCGCGHNDFVLKKHFQVTGIDRSDAMIGLAKKLNPEVRYLKADMRNARLDAAFDAVVALDSIDYLLLAEDLKLTFATAWRHLNPGGVFLFLIEELKEDFDQNRIIHWTKAREDAEVAVIENRYDPNPLDTNYESVYVYLIRRKGKLSMETDLHRCGLFPSSVFEKVLAEIGFQVRRLAYEPAPGQASVEHAGLVGRESYPMFIGIKE
jgi:SAM-dependent methyltransferase